MRGIVITLSRLTAACARCAPAAAIALSLGIATAAWAGPPKSLRAGASGTGFTHAAAASSEGDTVAYAVPRGAPLDGAEVVLPTPLEPSAAAQYRRIFSLQAAGKTAAADALMARLDDKSLIGTVLAARYLGPHVHASAANLQSWLSQYGDQPEAPQIYDLLLRRLPRGAATPMPPAVSLLADPAAESVGTLAAPRTVETPGWRKRFVTGLDDWKRGDISAAGAIFQQTAAMDGVSAEERAIGAFWAARAALRQQNPNAYLDWLHTAAAETGTFYGILAERLLGQDFSAPQGMGIGGTGIGGAGIAGAFGAAPVLTEADVTAIDALPNGHLAFALLQAGQGAAADDALRSLRPELAHNPGLARAALAVAARAGLVDVAVAIAGADDDATGNAIAGASLPLPPLRPDGGFSVDPALVYALARTESGFDPRARSGVGALGMMQLMPVTARFIAKQTGLRDAPENPAANLALGQGYLHYLGTQPGISGNLMAILASYNAGPNAASAWYGALKEDSDPLLFLETIPNDETRHFVRRVLADCWIYDGELGMPPRSLDAVAEGNFPTLQDYALASN